MENNLKINTDILECIKNIQKEDIDVSLWEKYKLADLFEIKGSKTTTKKSLEQKGKGKHPYITTTASNQGVSGYYNFYTENGNVLTFDSAVLGTCFYQEKNFSASDHVELGIPKYKGFNKKIGLYFQIIINKTNEGIYHYGNKANQQRIKDTTIKLPSRYNEETSEIEPDWEYMENYITNLEKELNIEKINNIINNVKDIKEKSLNTNNWISYKIKDLFNIKKGVRLNKINREKGEIPFLTATFENNGVSNYINPKIIKMELCKNALTIDMFFNVFFHRYDFLCDDNVHVLTLKNKDLTNNIGIFLRTVFNSNKADYNYSKQLRLKYLINEKIKLPSKYNEETSEIEPDWDYMESYIENLEKE